MELILIRHAHAEISYPDEKRNLTLSGIKEFQNNCNLLMQKIDSIDLILSSPLTRAVQTGDILDKTYGLKDSFFVEKSLSPGCDFNDIIDLATIYNVERLVCIFHLPDIAYNFTKFCPTASQVFDFNPGTIAAISFEEKIIEGNGKLKFFIQ